MNTSSTEYQPSKICCFIVGILVVVSRALSTYKVLYQHHKASVLVQKNIESHTFSSINSMNASTVESGYSDSQGGYYVVLTGHRTKQKDVLVFYHILMYL